MKLFEFETHVLWTRGLQVPRDTLWSVLMFMMWKVILMGRVWYQLWHKCAMKSETRPGWQTVFLQCLPQGSFPFLLPSLTVLIPSLIYNRV